MYFVKTKHQMKAGRNDPCPCGSGKKYKKCCLEKEEQAALSANLAATPRSSRYEPFADEPQPKDKPADENREGKLNMFGKEEEPDDVLEEEDDDISKYRDVSDEDIKIANDWWEKFRKMNDTVQEREHLMMFIEQHPDLVNHLETYHEVLSELGAHHFRDGIYETFVELLLQIRKDFPVTYKAGFEYYDSDLIYWYVSQGRSDEINMFFEYFKKEIDYKERMDDLHLYFQAINRPNVLLSELAGANQNNRHLSWIISWNASVNTIQGYIDKTVNDETVQSLLNDLAEKGIVDDEHSKDNIKNRLSGYMRQFEPWSKHLQEKSLQTDDFYSRISLNFAYFLYKNTELSFSSAITYSEVISDHYHQMISGEESPADIFCLDENSITGTINKNNTVFWGYKMKCFIELNAFYYYAAYLKTCGDITEEKKCELQETVTNLFRKTYEVSKDQGPEMLAFKRFPLWEIKDNIDQ